MTGVNVTAKGVEPFATLPKLIAEREAHKMKAADKYVGLKMLDDGDDPLVRAAADKYSFAPLLDKQSQSQKKEQF